MFAFDGLIRNETELNDLAAAAAEAKLAQVRQAADDPRGPRQGVLGGHDPDHLAAEVQALAPVAVEAARAAMRQLRGTTRAGLAKAGGWIRVDLQGVRDPDSGRALIAVQLREEPDE